jgi:asparagine synthase (glutamine-hydrolysing)
VIAAFDEPFADSSAVPTLLVSQLARTRVTVALSGDGGDEIFGGYTRYSELARRGGVVLPTAIRQALSRAIGKLPHAMRGRNRLLEFCRTGAGRYAGMVAHPLLPNEGGVARPELSRAGADLDLLLARWFDEVPERDMLTRASFVDLINYLPNDILTKVDRMSMAVSLEARVPLLDHHLVEFASSLPARFRWRAGVGKWVFREAVRDLVPAAVLQQPKQGFGVPLRHWFRGALRHRVAALLNPAAAIYEYVEPAAVSRIVREHNSERRDHSAMLWKLLVLESWLATPNLVSSPLDFAAAG